MNSVWVCCREREPRKRAAESHQGGGYTPVAHRCAKMANCVKKVRIVLISGFQKATTSRLKPDDFYRSGVLSEGCVDGHETFKPGTADLQTVSRTSVHPTSQMFSELFGPLSLYCILFLLFVHQTCVPEPPPGYPEHPIQEHFRISR